MSWSDPRFEPVNRADEMPGNNARLYNPFGNRPFGRSAEELSPQFDHMLAELERRIDARISALERMLWLRIDYRLDALERALIERIEALPPTTGGAEYRAASARFADASTRDLS